MDRNLLEEIRNRLDQMSREELVLLNQILDMIELRQSDPAPAQAPVQEET